MAADDMETSSAQSQAVAANNPLEQFVLLAKTAKGAACLELIKQVLEAPGVHVFGELLDMPNIKELENGPHEKCFKTLNLFAYGTYKQYLANKSEFLDLTAIMCKKLQHLTIVSLAIKNKCISYNLLLEELHIANVRDLEDLIIEAIYADIIHGKLDQKHKLLEVDYAIGRDIRPGDVSLIVSTLQEWCDSCETVLACIETQIHRANSEKTTKIKHKADIEQQINNIKKSLKSQSNDPEEAMSSEPREVVGQDKMKKSSKSKGIRVGGKFWNK
uniref:Putative cop9 signalosome complex subunit 7a n=1 Tax=Xenopsylla cheopis TaxID=163159 RepID=A0A6M2DS68_XENCH